MNILKKAFCRVVQFAFKLAIPFLPYTTPKILEDCIDIISILQEKNINCILLVVSNSARKYGLTNSLEENLKLNNIEFIVYDKVKQNPTISLIEEGVKLYNSNNCLALVAFGGGSQIDCAKAIGARIAYPNKTIPMLKGTLKVLKKLPTLIAIPTTAGSGSETTVAAVVTDDKTSHKYTLNNFTMIPKYAVLDPKLTYTLPKHLTATTGLDALTHAVEAFIGRSRTISSKRDALEAVKLIFDNILIAYNEPNNYNARKNMLRASYLAGCAFTKSYVGYIHAIAHTLGGQYDTPHGLANSVIMPVVLKEYGSSVTKKLAKLALKVGLADISDTYDDASNKFIAGIIRLNEQMNIPKTFDFIKEEDIKMMVNFADKEANPLYPVPKLFGKNELEKIYYQIKS